MATNPYIHPQQGYKSEHDLYEDMIIENIQISGLDFIYIPRTLSDSFSQVFGEDILSSFDSHAVIEMWMEEFASGYGGESEMLSKFGIEIRDTCTFIVSRKRFHEVVSPILPANRPDTLAGRPCEGDLIYVDFSKSLFEIKFVEDEAPGFYQLNKKFVWTLRCELTQLNNENFATGDTTVDTIYNVNLNRLNSVMIQEDGFDFICEDGGCILSEDYVVSEAYNDVLGYGDNLAIKKEFMEIMSFDEKNPFSNESF